MLLVEKKIRFYILSWKNKTIIFINLINVGLQLIIILIQIACYIQPTDQTQIYIQFTMI